MEQEQEPELLLAQFNRLIQELVKGPIRRNTFRPWEIDLLLDMEKCEVKRSARRLTLLRYQRAVQRLLENGARGFPLLSEFLASQRKQRIPVAD